MEKTQHLFEGGVYLIGNKAVAKNPLFVNLDLQQYFLEKMEQHLAPICDILGYSLADDQYHLLLRLKSRKYFESYFLSKADNVALNLPDIPESTYIFSQAMANFQVSYVKRFNFKMKRSGALMASRFTRKLIESQIELEEWINILNSGKKLYNYAKQWSNEISKPQLLLNSGWLYGMADAEWLRSFERSIEYYINGITSNLGGSFRQLPPKRLASNKSFFLKQYNRLFGPISPG